MTASDALWERYRPLVDEWADNQRERAVTEYRREHEPAQSATGITGYAPIPAALAPPPAPAPDFAYQPTRSLPPTTPTPPTVSEAAKWGAGGAGIILAAWALMMAEGWSSGAGYLVPILVIIGLVLAAGGGAIVAIVRYQTRKGRYAREMVTYRAMSEQAAREFDEQHRRALDAKIAQSDAEADRLMWQQMQAAASRQPQIAVSDGDILAQFDEQRADLTAAAVEQGRSDGEAPASTNEWLAATAALMKRTSDAIDTMTAHGWDVALIDSADSRDVIVVTGADLPADTTVQFHHATPQQLREKQEQIATYDDEALAYRPIPGTDHESPAGAPQRVVHIYTHWKVLGLDSTEHGYGIIGTDAYVTDWEHLLQAIESATLD